jgi:hypothetical protein
MKINISLLATLWLSISFCWNQGVASPIIDYKSQDERFVYVWEFKTRAGVINDLTRTVTNEFEEALVQRKCPKVLERKDYPDLKSQIENEKAISLNALSEKSINSLKHISANTVIFGEIYFDHTSGLVNIAISVEAFSGVIQARKSTWVERLKVLNPKELRPIMVGLAEEITTSFSCPIIFKPILSREFEITDSFTIGQSVARSEASNQTAHGQFGCLPNEDYPAQAGQIEFKSIHIPNDGEYWIEIIYSKDSPQQTVPIQIFLNEIEKANFVPEPTGSWNIFTNTVLIPLGKLDAGIYTLKFYTIGQQYGVADLDKFIISTTK